MNNLIQIIIMKCQIKSDAPNKPNVVCEKLEIFVHALVYKIFKNNYG